NVANEELPDLNLREYATLVPLVILAFWIGIYPKPLFAVIDKPVANVLRQVNPHFYKAEQAKLPQAEAGDAECTGHLSIPFIDAIRSYLQGDGAVILPEMELVLFGLGIMLIDFWVEEKEKYLNAVLAMAGTLFSGVTLWMLRGQLAVKGVFTGFHNSVVVDGFFLFFGLLFLVSTALVILLSAKYLQIEREQE